MKSFRKKPQRIKILKEALHREIDAGYVTVRIHPTKKDLCILNYTQRTQIEKHWNDITRRCRGLVVEWKNSGDYVSVIIDSPQKFFNLSEPEAPDASLWLVDDTYISEKLDGYYISIRNDSKYGLIVTSRGSFENQYVDAAMKLLPTGIPKDTDFFCELCQDFPGDESIIVTKHPVPRLVCWGVNHTVPTQENTYGWNGEIANKVSEEQLKRYLKCNVEGIVIFRHSTGERVKVKTKWYLNLHRAISNCTFKNTLEVVCGGGRIRGETVTKYIDRSGEEQTLNVSQIPEEHYTMMCVWENQITDAYTKLMLKATTDFEAYKKRTPKEYALESNSPREVKNITFAMLQKKKPDEIQRMAWTTIRRKLERESTDK